MQDFWPVFGSSVPAWNGPRLHFMPARTQLPEIDRLWPAMIGQGFYSVHKIHWSEMITSWSHCAANTNLIETLTKTQESQITEATYSPIDS